MHRSRTLVDEVVTSQGGLPTTTPARTIADLRRATSTRGCPATVATWELRRAIRQAEVLGLETEAEHLTERSKSDLEIEFLRLCRRQRIPEPEVNARIGGLEVDFLWRDARLAVETDGYRYHRGRLAFENDRERDLKLRMLGYDVIRLSGAQVADDPARVGEALRDALAVSV